MRLTLEVLETHGVPVIGYGTDELPAFYSRRSGLAVDQRLDTPEQVAAVLRAQWGAGLSGGVVVAQPIAAEHELPPGQIDQCIDQALQEAQALSGGASLASNIELVLANARLAARIAVAYAALGDAGGA